jgi:hypothetical protein
MSSSIKKHLLMSNLHLYGKSIFHFHYSLFSIIMELANHGDVFQKILEHKKLKTYIKEKEIW